jgi:hypothetical protein
MHLTYFPTDIPGDEDEESWTTTKLGFNTLTQTLLPCLPKLKNLIINAIYSDQDNHQLRYRVCFLIRILNEISLERARER